MATFTELAATLDKQLKTVTDLKAALDKLSAELSKKAEEYNKAVEDAKATRTALDNAMNDALGRELKSKIG